ncbi:MAG: DUF3833 domain-containing protein [Marivibrio sp.]|uniref:DUF3833 domain-containing protein n=1 Tax=Marivibrio sp. TaxID=2039719 RepID=UPI0032F00988
MRKLAVMMAAFLALAGCSGMKVEDFKNEQPKLTLEDYFEGRSKAWGVFEDRFGNVRRQFTVDIEGSWDEAAQELTLVEDFDYSDGETERRVWELTKTGPTTYEGTAGGVVGVAKGEISGNAFNWTYTFDLPVGGSTWRVDFDDWMFLQPGGVIVNRATVSKWGIDIGRAMIFFRKVDAASEEASAPVSGAKLAAE